MLNVVVLLLNFAFALGTSSSEIPFVQALSEMVDKDLDVCVQRTNISASESQLLAAEGGFTPSLNLQAQQLNSDGKTTTTVPLVGQSYMANVTWNVFRSGADVAALRAAKHNRSYQMALLDSNYLRAEDKAAKALLDYIGKKQTVEAYRRNEESARHFLEVANARFNRSLLSREEADKVALDAATAEARRADTEVQLNLARATVESMLGHSRVVGEWPWTGKLEPESLSKLLLEDPRSIDLRPDVVAAKAAVETEESRSRSVFRSMLPTVDLTYTIGENHIGGTIYPTWSSMATLTIPLWNGWRDYSAYRVQVESKFASEIRLNQTQKEAQSEIEAAQANYKVSLQQYQSRLRTLTTAKRILERDDARFKIGRADANELNLDLGRVTGAEILAIQGTQSVHLAYMQLLHAFGKRIH